MSNRRRSSSPEGPAVPPRFNGSHDVGGAGHLGPVPVDAEGKPFEEPWEGAVMAMSLSGVVSGIYSVDHHRAAVEGMHPVAYQGTSYYEQWLCALETCLVAAGAVTREEIEERMVAVADDPDTPLPEGENEELVQRLKGLLAYGIPPGQLDSEPKFGLGDEIETRVIRVRPGEEHTRLPGYVQGKPGVVERVNPPEPLADALVAGEGMKPEYVYTIRFRSRELWPDAGEEDSVTVDVWESYMEPAGTGSDGKRSKEKS